MDKNFNGTFKPLLSETEIYVPQGNQIQKKSYIAQYQKKQGKYPYNSYD